MKIKRRTVIAAAAGFGAVAATGGLLVERATAGTLDGANAKRGHRLRMGDFPAPQHEEKTGILIAGGGAAGLTAGWMLSEAGYSDFQLLELEDSMGGNARSGKNAISAYPLGAHYLPVPNKEAKALRHMLGRLKVITGEKDGKPLYDPYQLCADLEERLFWRGKWQEGLFPSSGLSQQDLADRQVFDAAMKNYSEMTGSDNKPAFAVPMAYSSQDPGLLALDAISFAKWLDQKQLNSPILRSYVRYCCRDDYGCEPSDVSAWAGIHYFAGRRGWAADDAGDTELTWPEGNGRLTSLMAHRISPNLRPARTVFSAKQNKHGGVTIDSFDAATGKSIRTHAVAAILAMPHFVATRIAPAILPRKNMSYAPWIVANVSVNRPPQGRGAKLAWDNVSAGSQSLGYVVATHQDQSSAAGPTVLTWYLPLSDMPPAKARRQMLNWPLVKWQKMVRDDLLAMHPELTDAISRIDVWRWGHAMVRPVPGYISKLAPQIIAEVKPPLFLAHSDLSGLSLFEEAHYRGTAAAENAMRHIGHQFESLL
jgi:hypothetical protein